MPVQLVRHPLLKRHLVLSRSLLWTACLPWFQFLFSGPHTFMPDEKSMQILLTFASLLMDFCSGGRNVAYAYNRKEAKAGVARYTGTSDLHFGMATSTETTHAIVAPTCVNNFDLLVCHMTYCHILSHIVTYCHIECDIRLERFVQDFQLHGASRFCPHNLSIFGMKRTPNLNQGNPTAAFIFKMSTNFLCASATLVVRWQKWTRAVPSPWFQSMSMNTTKN